MSTTGRGGTDADGDAGGALAKLEAHLKDLDDASLLRIVRAVETARAAARPDPTDDQILHCLRPRLRELRPQRVPSFQRAVCAHLEPFLYDGDMPDKKAQGWIPRAVIAGWWEMLITSRHGAALREAESLYAAAIQSGRPGDAAEPAARGSRIAAEATAELAREADHSIDRRTAMLRSLGSDRAMLELGEIATILSLAPHLTPALGRVRSATGITGGRIADFVPPAVLAARSAYVEFHESSGALIEYFFFGLVQMLVQPWQALRLVRMLSTDMSKAGEGHLNLIPTRLFNDLTRTLMEIGRATGTEQGMSRRVWLMTCARLVADAAAMIKGLAEEGQVENDPAWNRLLGEARSQVNAAVDAFAGVAVKDSCLVLPIKHVQEKGPQARQEPDMARRPTEEEVQTAQAAALLFAACRRYADQEGLDRSLRPKEADLIHRLQIGINFRVEFLRARTRDAACLAQLSGVAQVLKALPQTEPVTDLGYRVERTLERYR